MTLQCLQLKPVWRRFKAVLDDFDQRNTRRFKILLGEINHLDQQTANWIKMLAHCARQFVRVVIRGGSKGIVKRRTGSRLGDFLSAVFYKMVYWLDKLDSMIWFPGRIHQAKVCRVRSKAEKKIANWLTDHRIKFVYEKPLKLGKITVHPDFYLVEFHTYLEYWGLAGVNQEYTGAMKKKLRFYQEHGVKVISLYPKHLKDRRGLNTVLPDLIEAATGAIMPERR